MPPKYRTLPKLADWKEDYCDPQSRMFNKFCMLYKVDPPTMDRLRDDMQQDFTMAAICDLLSCNDQKISDAGAQIWLLFDLFQALQAWKKQRAQQVNLQKKHTSFQKRSPFLEGLEDIRAKAAANLYESVCHMLASRLVCTVNVLPTKLEQYFGKNLTQHGIDLDLKRMKAEYLDRVEANKFRLIFIKKKAYMLPWWDDKSDVTTDTAIKLELADTTHAHERTPDKSGFTARNEAFCVLGMSSQFYVAPHGPQPSGRQHYHSSYLSGENVLCAGSIVLEKGAVTYLSNKSGHYQPTPTHILHCLNALAANGLAHDDITIEVCLGNAPNITFPTVAAFKKWLAAGPSFNERATDIALSNIEMQKQSKARTHYWLQRHVKKIGE
ncbi:MAG: hypothetical protein AB1916_05375 [Thermodesulfobacteriota bacterium]